MDKILEQRIASHEKSLAEYKQALSRAMFPGHVKMLEDAIAGIEKALASHNR